MQQDKNVFSCGAKSVIVCLLFDRAKSLLIPEIKKKRDHNSTFLSFIKKWFDLHYEVSVYNNLCNSLKGWAVPLQKAGTHSKHLSQLELCVDVSFAFMTARIKITKTSFNI